MADRGAPAPFGGGLAPEAAPVSFPPHLYPPRGATVVDKSYGPRFIPPGPPPFPLPASDQTELQVPLNVAFRLSALGFGSVDPTAVVFATYSLLVNDNPVYGYTNQSVTVGTLDTPSPVFLVIPGPSTVRLQVTNGFPLTGFNYIARLQGWFFQEFAR